MIESGEPIAQLERQILRRLRLLAFQDLIALSGLISAGLAIILFVLLRLGLFNALVTAGIGTGERFLLCCIPVAATFALVALHRFLTRRGRWRSNLDVGGDRVDVIIDRALDLEDRTRTAGSIIRRGGPHSVMEAAQIEDAASRLACATPERIVEPRLPHLSCAVRCYTSVGSSIIAALVVVVGIVQYRTPARAKQEADAGTIALMQAVGDNLEQSTNEIEQSVNQNTPTAALARQQAELARALKQSATRDGRARGKPINRSQALQELSVLAEKLGDRKNELENTRASEILSLAERRFQSTLWGTTKLRPTPAGRRGTDKSQLTAGDDRADKPHQADHDQVHSGHPSAVDKSAVDKSGRPNESATQAEAADSDKAAPTGNSMPRGIGFTEGKGTKGRRESKATEKNGVDLPSKEDAQNDGKHADGAASTQADGDIRAPKVEAAPASTEEDGKAGAAGAQMLPDLSKGLLEKAAELRAGNLTPADVEQLRKAAEGLLKDLSVKDLANLVNSKEIKQTLEQLARQVDPQQMEQLARQLLSQKEVRDELQAVSKLLMENSEAKETIAGFADRAREIAEQFQKQGYSPGRPPGAFPLLSDPSAKAGSRIGSSGAGTGDSLRNHRNVEALNGTGRSAGPGRSRKPENLNASKAEGEPIYGRARPGAAPARVPYSTAYPGYRREAERTVERSQVPARMRALVRSYFDAINPDAGKQP